MFIGNAGNRVPCDVIALNDAIILLSQNMLNDTTGHSPRHPCLDKYWHDVEEPFLRVSWALKPVPVVGILSSEKGKIMIAQVLTFHHWSRWVVGQLWILLDPGKVIIS